MSVQEMTAKLLSMGPWCKYGPTANLNVPEAPSRFRIVKEYAKGGLGVVFVAEDLQIRREVALKQIRMDCTDVVEYSEKFNREAELTGQLEHPGIDPVYALGTDESRKPLYAMRFVSGEESEVSHSEVSRYPQCEKSAIRWAEWRKLAAEATKECDESKAALLLFFAQPFSQMIRYHKFRMRL